MGDHPRLEAMYREWNELERREWRRAIVPSAAFPAMFDRHRDMVAGFDDEALKARMAANADLLEAYAVLAFNRAAQNLGTPRRARTEKINPYAVSLDPERWEADGLLDGEGLTRDRGARVAGGRDGEPVHGGDRDARVTLVGHADACRSDDARLATRGGEIKRARERAQRGHLLASRRSGPPPGTGRRGESRAIPPGRTSG